MLIIKFKILLKLTNKFINYLFTVIQIYIQPRHSTQKKKINLANPPPPPSIAANQPILKN